MGVSAGHCLAQKSIRSRTYSAAAAAVVVVASTTVAVVDLGSCHCYYSFVAAASVHCRTSYFGWLLQLAAIVGSWRFAGTVVDIAVAVSGTVVVDTALAAAAAGVEAESTEPHNHHYLSVYKLAKPSAVAAEPAEPVEPVSFAAVASQHY